MDITEVKHIEEEKKIKMESNKKQTKRKINYIEPIYLKLQSNIYNDLGLLAELKGLNRNMLIRLILSEYLRNNLDKEYQQAKINSQGSPLDEDNQDKPNELNSNGG